MDWQGSFRPCSHVREPGMPIYCILLRPASKPALEVTCLRMEGGDDELAGLLLQAGLLRDHLGHRAPAQHPALQVMLLLARPEGPL